MTLQNVLLWCIAAYLIGAVPFPYIIGRLNGINIFSVGSGNMGANNVTRALGLGWGLITWFLDSAKGIIAILVARRLADGDHLAWATMIGAVAAIVGHTWSIFAYLITRRIRGGKGAATAVGTWFMFMPLLAIAVVMILGVLIVLITRYVSLGALLTNGAITVIILLMVAMGNLDPIYLGYLIISAIIFYRHRENMVAIWRGTERRFGERAKLPNSRA